jgi:hypothetical protein
MNDQNDGLVQSDGFVVYPERRVRLGTVAVDSGRLLLADPTYIRNLGEIDTLDDTLIGDRHAISTLEGTSLLFTAGLGDGVYDVFATVGTVVGWGDRVKRVEVVLIDEEIAQARADRNADMAISTMVDGDASADSGVADIRADLLEMAELQHWEVLPFAPDESAGGSEEMWRTFTATAPDDTLRLALDAAWDQWVETSLTPAWEKVATRWYARLVRSS